MSTIRRITFALTLGIAAASAAVLPAAPADACGSYGDLEDMRVRGATFVFMNERMPSAQDRRIHDVKIEGNTAHVQIRFRSPNRTEDSAQILGLAKDSRGAWKVAVLGYTVPASVADKVYKPS